MLGFFGSILVFQKSHVASLQWGILQEFLPTKNNVLQRMLQKCLWLARTAYKIEARKLVNVSTFCDLFPVRLKATLDRKTFSNTCILSHWRDNKGHDDGCRQAFYNLYDFFAPSLSTNTVSAA